MSLVFLDLGFLDGDEVIDQFGANRIAKFGIGVEILDRAGEVVGDMTFGVGVSRSNRRFPVAADRSCDPCPFWPPSELLPPPCTGFDAQSAMRCSIRVALPRSPGMRTVDAAMVVTPVGPVARHACRLQTPVGIGDRGE